MDIKNYIKQFIIDNQEVVIPGLGGFFAEYEAAAFDVTENKFLPPSQKISFTPEYSFSDTNLINFIAQKEKIDKKEAKLQVESFVKQIKNQLEAGKNVEFPAIGILSQTKNGEIIFTQDINSNLLTEAFGLKVLKTEPIREHTEVKQTPKKPKINNRLFIYISSVAAILLIIALIWYFTEGYWNINFISSSDTPPTESGNAQIDKSESETYLNNIAKADSLKAAINQTIDVTTDKKEALFYKEPETKPEGRKQQYSQFQIIAGSFKKIENAEKFCRDLKQLGYEPEIIESDKNVLRVSIYSYTDETSALKKLYKLREASEIKAVWILKTL